MPTTLPALTSFHGLVGLGLIFGCLGAALLVPLLAKLSRRTVAGIAVTFLAFQAFHLLEHLIQLTYWFFNPSARPYMTPWARDGVDGLAAWFDLVPGAGTAMAGGMEGLHLVGNVIFLVGIIALGRVTDKPLPGVKAALTLQGLHVAEHVLLTGTLWLFGTPMGISTLFGAAYDYGWGSTLRVWFHFLINLGGTIPAAWAVWKWRRLHSVAAPAIDESVIIVMPRQHDRELLATSDHLG